MFSDLIPGLVVGIIFTSIVWVIDRVTSRRALNKERLRLIEKEGDLSQLKSGETDKIRFKSDTLKYGLIAIGISIGSLVGSIFEQNKVLANDEIGYLFAISLFVGIALIGNHYLSKKENKESK